MGRLDATATVLVTGAPGGARLDAWIDFNGDGSWGGTGERIAEGAVVSEGTNAIRFDVPSWALPGGAYARFRLSTAGVPAVTGAAADGEVEDYRITIEPPAAGSGFFVPQKPLAGELSHPSDVFSADLDGDGDLDVLVASEWDDRVTWYENQGSGHFTAHTITTTLDSVNSVSAADLDGDGDLDVLAASQSHNGVFWYENQGEGQFGDATGVGYAREAMSVFAADLDQDGDVDVLSTSLLQGVYWYENDGAARFTDHTITENARGAWSVFAADMDGDGDTDVLSASAHDDTVAWYENDGSEGFTQRIITTTADWARSVRAADLDGDGDMDVLSASTNDDTIAWYEQAATLPAELGEVDWRELPGLDLSAGDKLYRFTGAHAGILTVDATFNPAGGEVTLRLFDEAGTLVDEMTGRQGNARFDYSQPTGGAAYLLQVTGVNPDVDLRICNLVENVAGAVTVHGTAASDDFGYLAGAEHKLTINSIPYRFGLRKIRTVHFVGGAGSDVATLTGSAANETARLLPGRGSITNTSLSFTVSVDDAWDITISGGGGYDTLDVTDSDGDDRLVISPGLAEMTGTSAGGAYAVRGNAFRIVNGYAKSGGNDTAVIASSDSARAKVYPDLVKLTAANSYGRVKFFDTTTVEMLAGSDTGVVSPSTRQDALWAMKGEARVAYNMGLPAGSQPAFDGLAYDVTILGCERLTALADGGDDWLELHDSALNDVLIAKPHKTEIMNGPRATDGILRGEEYAVSARRYQNVQAIADQGGEGDGAKLYDSAELGVDVWAAGYVDGKTWSTMSLPSRRLYQVLAFDQVGGYGFNGTLGPDHGTNRKQHTPETDFVFQSGYWEGDE